MFGLGGFLCIKSLGFLECGQMNEFLHEALMRGEDTLKKLAEAQLTICGLGAIGSNLAESLARQGFKNFFLIDFDRIEEHNIGTQSYFLDELGMLKALALSNHLYRISKTIPNYSTMKLDEANVKRLLSESGIVIDSFDESESRKVVTEFCLKNRLSCLHIGLNESYGEIMWNEGYRIPQDRGLNACNYPLSRNIIILTIAVASETLIDFVLTGKRTNRFLTLKDFTIEEMEV